MKRIVIIGAGGHAKVIAETIDLLDNLQVVGFIDDRIEKGTPVYKDIPVIGAGNEIPQILEECDALVIGIGNNEVRKQLAERIKAKSFEIIIHPRAVVSKTAVIEPGTVVLAGAVISSNARVAAHCIVNSHVVIDHDSNIGTFVHLSIGTLVGSNSKISELTTTQIGQSVPSFSTI
ncbi:hypothetical protein [Fluviicola sp.]|jgi:acetyltransferase EpsM|uniref:PglD-related sugar-binding protein n=1 Tax=Fluviicola sp. TaxID=1917219 RepID=UPI00282F50F6|nr:hypothetical protein [Fluviicola sp.]MDR0802359.1 hypothetical protein [Fluviicola sp.]